jgi:hypothetical protein
LQKTWPGNGCIKGENKIAFLQWGDIVTSFAWFIAFYMVIVIVFLTAILITSFFQLRKEYQLDRVQAYEDYLDEIYTKPVSIIVPAYNEEAGIIQSVRSLLSINYPSFEVIVVIIQIFLIMRRNILTIPMLVGRKIIMQDI